ncbi:MAG: Ni/Fe-hydrogenase, b-type cytochrome subunit [Betaproteobacteria bacterium]|nr:Ni/Fe-hydrogenase, b-type cytochrome subunit [Betaproteobacteria bacterium]
MRVERVTGRVLNGPMEDVYVYEAPVRLWHWITAFCICALVPTGYLIGAPLPSIGGEATASFLMGWIRTVHFVAAMLLIVMFVLRLYWVFVGNHHARAIFIPAVWSGAWWKGVIGQAKYYLFLQEHSDNYVGHNPLAQMAMFTNFLVALVVIIVTGLGLYAQAYGWGSGWMTAFGWVTTLFGTPQAVRTAHHLSMWYMLLFIMIHFYMVIREDIMSGGTVFGVMGSGIRMFKREPKP